MVFVGDPLHHQRIRYDETAELEVVLQYPLDEVWRDGSRNSCGRIVGGDRDMPDHHGFGARLDRRLERRELDFVVPIPAVAQGHQPQVGVDIGIAVPREVFDGRDHPAVLRPLHEGRTHLAHELDVIAKRPGVNDRIAGIVVHIDRRGVVLLDAERPPLQSRDFAHLIRVFRIPCSADGHCTRERGGAVHPHTRAVFKIRCDQERDIAQPL